MERCYACKSGKVKQHGSFKYCDSCSYAAFVMTNDYISSAAALIGTLVSNTRFDTVEGWSESIQQFIYQHTPVLADFTKTMDNEALVKFSVAFAEEVITQAVNLELPEELQVIYDRMQEPEINKACVGCGVNHFMTEGRVHTCMSCDVKHTEDHKGNKIPLFTCECSSIKYDEIDELLVQCSNCRQPYLRIGSDGLQFQKVGA